LGQSDEIDGGDVAAWPWLVVLPSILNTLLPAANAQSCVGLWEFLEVWLEFGVPPPQDIILSDADGHKGEFGEHIVKFRVHIDSPYRSGIRTVDCWFRLNPARNDVAISAGLTKPTSLTELVKSFNPPKASTLLKYIERNSKSGIAELPMTVKYRGT